MTDSNATELCFSDGCRDPEVTGGWPDEPTLLPCPFCGGEAELIESECGMFQTGYAVYCTGKCRVKMGVSGRLSEVYEWTPVFDTEAEAIAAWNARYHRGLTEEDYNILLDELGVSERTCRNENGNDKYASFICSECGLHMHKPDFGRSYVDEDGKRWYSTSSEHGLHYCPNCGSRVVK